MDDFLAGVGVALLFLFFLAVGVAFGGWALMILLGNLHVLVPSVAAWSFTSCVSVFWPAAVLLTAAGVGVSASTN